MDCVDVGSGRNESSHHLFAAFESSHLERYVIIRVDVGSGFKELSHHTFVADVSNRLERIVTARVNVGAVSEEEGHGIGVNHPRSVP